MMITKKVLLISRAKTDKAKQKASDFSDKIQKLSDKEILVENCEISELFFELDENNISIYHPQKSFDLRDFDLVIIRHIGNFAVEAHMISTYCEYFGIRYTDTYLNRLLLDNKISTMLHLWCHGIKSWPKTFYGNTTELKRRFSELGNMAIFKDNEGSKGRLNFLIKSASEIDKILNANPDKKFILQEFIPNSGDLRILIMNGEPTLVIKRSSNSDSHLNNTSQGGSATILPLGIIEKPLLDLAVNASIFSKLQVAGVDLVQHSQTGHYYLFEINNAPQISSGSFRDEKARAYSKMIKKLLSDTANKASISHIGSTAHVEILGRKVPAKIDTGADSSAIWASDIKVTKDNILKFKLFAPGSPFYTGKVIKRKDFKVSQVKSSNGQTEIRYRAPISVNINGKQIRISFNLSDRSKNQFPVLIGRRTLKNKFLVDVSKRSIATKTTKITLVLNRKLARNPRQFYLKHKRGKIVL